MHLLKSTIKNCLLLFSLSAYQNGFCQDYDISRLVNKSQSVSVSAGANGNSVDLFRGTLNSNIPLYTYQGREVNLPISLSYSATGIKVDQVASNVGLGWNLNVGGKITRIPVAEPDDRHVTNQNACPWIHYQTPPSYYLKDYYKVDALGFSDTFQFGDAAAWVRSLLNPNIQISVNSAGYYTGGNNAEWTIYDETGNMYVFGGTNATEGSITNTTGQGCNNIDETSSTGWYLTKFVSKNKLDTYRFEYQNFNWQSVIPNNGEGSRENDVLKLTQSSYKLKQKMITTIYHNDVKIITFDYTDRDDLTFEGNQGNALANINILRYMQDDIALQFNFNYSYFGQNNPEFNTNFLHKRLKLDSIVTNGSGSGQSTLRGDTYQFNYYLPENLPPIDSYARDYLGLYNGQTGNQNLVDNAFSYHEDNGYPNNVGIINSNTQNDLDFNPPNSNRSFHLEFAKIGILESITYPNKGKSVFAYGQNALNGGFGTTVIPQTQTTVYDDLVLVNNNSECYYNTDPYDGNVQYSSPNTNMLAVNFRQFDGYSNLPSNTHTLSKVRTYLLKNNYDQDKTFKFTFGHGENFIYLIQKTNACDDAQNVTSYCGLGQNPTPIMSFNPSCLKPTTDIYCTGTDLSYVSQPNDFVKSGLIISSQDEYFELALPVGNYQITVWDYDNQIINDDYNYSHLKVTTTSTSPRIVTIPQQIINNDLISDYIDGFRIESITNFDKNDEFVSKKAYKYGGGVRTDLVNNYHRFYYALHTFDTFHLSRGYMNAPEIVHYTNVTEVELKDQNGSDNNGWVNYLFEHGYGKFFNTPLYNENDPRSPSFLGNYRYEKLDQPTMKTVVNNDGKLVYSEEYSYEYQTLDDGNEFIPDIVFCNLTHIKSKTYFPTTNTYIESNQNFTYDYNHLIAQSINNENTTYEYNPNLFNSNFYPPLSDFASQTKGVTKIQYGQVGNGANTRYLPTIIKHAKNSTLPLETTSRYEYDNDGNKVQTVQFSSGSLTPANCESYIYGYNNRFVVAKLSGVKYALIPNNLITQIKNLTQSPVSNSNEVQIRYYLSTLKDLFPEALITYYTYNPVFGITSVTDPKGYTLFTEYDALGRVISTKEANPINNDQFNVLSTNEYYIRN